MGFWNDGIRDRSPSRSPSRRSHYSSRPSYARSASSFFSLGGGSGNGSYFSSSKGHSRAKPRGGFINRVRRFLRQIYSYMRRNPVKVFFLVIMPLITGGALTRLLATVGVRLPRSLENLVGGSRGGADRFYARGGARDFVSGSALPGMGGGIGESIGGLMNLAKMFI
ncbi:hypothetical protein PV10_02032 [Exophiala mesophila]|uniref:Uncharacterized protein n=1 Tax=Exophiala mesophila TaxID=212818 RepID=A0A0D2A5F3_EXOME|nr:uncharacterized protein PV10_02032 [Exophiala mesophila]KIV94248.1 hypothetical protein PV10_02032 [Exophiala mesophila]